MPAALLFNHIFLVKEALVAKRNYELILKRERARECAIIIIIRSTEKVLVISFSIKLFQFAFLKVKCE